MFDFILSSSVASIFNLCLGSMLATASILTTTDRVSLIRRQASQRAETRQAIERWRLRGLDLIHPREVGHLPAQQ